MKKYRIYKNGVDANHEVFASTILHSLRVYYCNFQNWADKNELGFFTAKEVENGNY